MISRRFLDRSPRISLALVFIVWKSVLLVIAASSPGPGYDTSTTLLPQGNRSWSLPLVRWDAIYFTEIARRDYVFEQEWAFSWGLTRLIRMAVKYATTNHWLSISLSEAYVGIVISHASHLVAVQALYGLVLTLSRRASFAKSLALTTAILHIFSPAGIFLSAPCAESLFAALQFVGYEAYANSWGPDARGVAQRAGLILLGGLCFGLAMPIRSNGLLSGILFAYDAAQSIAQILHGHRANAIFIRLVLVVFAGSCVAIGAVIPQYLAYQSYCTVSSTRKELRPWCNNHIPSIYTFVQEHYWNNGFLRYWTLSNVPLFLLAAPVMSMLAYSGVWTFTGSTAIFSKTNGDSQPPSDQIRDPVHIMRVIAVPQMVLMVMTLLNSHVQIITRIASGYPVWYIWLACMVTGVSRPPAWISSTYIVRWMVLYAAIQGGLYASFLPPA